MRKLIFVLLLSLVAALPPTTSMAWGQRFQFGFTTKIYPPKDTHGFYYPNESQPIRAMPIFSKNNRGVYIAVGTERGFMSAALSNSSHLLLVDNSNEIVNYNRMTIMLLKGSRNLAHFRRLKTDPTFLINEAAGLNISDNEKGLILEIATGDWWNRVIEHGWDVRSNMSEFFKPPAETGNFVDAHYLYDEGMYNKVKQMAIDGRIEAHRVDLASDDDVAQMVKGLERTGLTIGVVDISNAWMQGYIGVSKTKRLLEQMRKIVRSDTIFLITDKYDHDERAKDTSPHKAWARYLGFTFGYIWNNGLDIPNEAPGYQGPQAFKFPSNALMQTSNGCEFLFQQQQ